MKKMTKRAMIDAIIQTGYIEENERKYLEQHYLTDEVANVYKIAQHWNGETEYIIQCQSRENEQWVEHITLFARSLEEAFEFIRTNCDDITPIKCVWTGDSRYRAALHR